MDRRRNMVLSPMKQFRKYLLLLCLLAAGNAWGQRGGGGREAIDPERLQTARIAYITTRISLKPEQAEKFWPVFNGFTNSRESLMRTMGDLSRGAETIGEEEAKSKLNQKLQLQQKLVDEEKVFIAEASKILTYRQLLLLQNIARDFNRYLYDRQRGPGK
jgi:mevalonate kinase